ncbi:unnamed protein product [Prorocentrum cordatum]|uniref:Uncharacterized protein n=1 Tax=Prorocentrum cordatum TaxID=2364126 RepID=A0ABN9PD37_9DINO|nr:unnamed protein product [Polarella glacialis]
MARRSGSSRLVLALAAAALALAVRLWAPPAGRLAAAAPAGAFAGAQLTRRAPPRAHLIARQSEKVVRVDKIVESLKELTLLEASELVKAIEDTFDVDASASGGAVMMAAPAAGGDGAADEKPAEKTEFDLVLKEVPKDKKIAILKVVRSITGLGLKEAKGMVDSPGKLLEAKPKDICEEALKQLEEAGAKAALE